MAFNDCAWNNTAANFIKTQDLVKALLGGERWRWEGRSAPSLGRRGERPVTALQRGIVLRDERDPENGNY